MLFHSEIAQNLVLFLALVIQLVILKLLKRFGYVLGIFNFEMFDISSVTFLTVLTFFDISKNPCLSHF